jgi:hypothetical protein
MILSSRSALFALVLTCVASPVWAQNEYEEQVLVQLEVVADVFISEGYEPMIWDSGDLDEGIHEVTLSAGFSYALMAVCDVDCSDIDLSLFDGMGDLIVEDTEIDDAPVIEFTVTSGGDFTLDVAMFECSTEPCYYGVALFGWSGEAPSATVAGTEVRSRIWTPQTHPSPLQGGQRAAAHHHGQGSESICR